MRAKKSSPGWRAKPTAGRATEADLDGLMAFYDSGREERRLRDRRPHGARGDSREPALRLPPRARARRTRRRGRGTASPTSISRRGCRSSCGARRPDEELLTLAAAGRLSNPGVLEQQARRMLADPRAEALGTRFAAQWLRLQDLDKVRPGSELLPELRREPRRRRCGARPSSSSTTSFAKTAACSSCSPPTTRS